MHAVWVALALASGCEATSDSVAKDGEVLADGGFEGGFDADVDAGPGDGGPGAAVDADYLIDSGPPLCEASVDCFSGLPYCIGGICRQCRGDTDCALGPFPHCVDGACLECATDDDCPAERHACQADGYCRECHTRADCPSDHPACSASGICEPCVMDEDCDAAHPYCLASGDIAICDACRVNLDCDGAVPYCVDGQCSGCRECACGTPRFPPGSIDCSAACAHLSTVCGASLASCWRCFDLPDALTPMADCLALCEAARSTPITDTNAEWGCLAERADCTSFRDCYFGACFGTTEPPPTCVPGPTPVSCSPALVPRHADGPGRVGDTCVRDTDCQATGGCYDGTCACGPGFVACGRECVDEISSPLNCGVCGNRCCSEQVCCNGACTPPPP